MRDSWPDFGDGQPKNGSVPGGAVKVEDNIRKSVSLANTAR
jgi:hypothetical protein